MLRKRSRFLHKDQYKDHLMSDSASESCSQHDGLGQKHKSSSFFSVPGLFVGFNIKCASDFDSTKSPTSPLDYRVLTNFGNPFRSPRSCSNGPQKIWDCSKVGLSIIDSLNNETEKSEKVLGLGDSKNILLGSKMRINIPASRSCWYGSMHSPTAPKSLPKNYFISPHAQISTPSFNLGSSEIAFRTEETQLEPKPLGKMQSCLSYSSRSLSPLTGLAYCKPNSSSEDFLLDKKTKSKSGSPLIGRGPSLENFLDIKPSSLFPTSIGSGHELMESLSVSEIELSESYTCVTSHGPNPRTTRIFGDCILECHTNELANCSKKEEQGIGLPQAIKCPGGSLPYPSDEFLSFCYFCRKKLEEGKDIYMYRGEKAFCSSSCRSQEILIEEEMEKPENNSSSNSPKSTYCEDIFPTGMVMFT